ncbi:hypothetical protein NQ117_06860 [Paenibacillus sp. SC116]|uniref:hypothetical protein n=1 Tax=Paenibacillus sp. SC116 TaxID=2968986 RepID=UPI00215A5AED|nr:hypothetical protein [Paenibacillus sp. SC116]MCR8843398.1 hypothetical protein [Paenibacillus sp. SC116]
MNIKHRKVYVLLSDTGSWLSQCIKWYTDKPLNHCSIVLDEELQEIYSFGRTREMHPLAGGFVKENLEGDLIRSPFRPTLGALYSCEVSEKQYEIIRQRIQYIDNRKASYKYNLLGLFGIALKVRIERNQAYFCSQFVAELFTYAGIELFEQAAEWIAPDDFRKCSRLKLEYKGDLRMLAADRHLPYTQTLWNTRVS